MKKLVVTEYDARGCEVTSYGIAVNLEKYEEPKMSNAAWDYFKNYGAMPKTKEMMFADPESKIENEDGFFEYEICEWIEVK